MYTFAPLVDSVDHSGFFLITVFVLLGYSFVLFGSDDVLEKIWGLIVSLIIISFSWFVSYVWTDQTPKTYKNEVVVGEFVSMNPEAIVKQGIKSQTSVERKMYVTYLVEGNYVALEANANKPYPKYATLYKN